MPDMELIVNLGDWPLSKLKKRDQTSSEPFPMFSWCGSKETWDIVWPTWDFMKSTIMGMDRYQGGLCKIFRDWIHYHAHDLYYNNLNQHGTSVKEKHLQSIDVASSLCSIVDIQLYVTHEMYYSIVK